ncbi:MAG: hypothetical protein RL064_523 [Bacteroidota bacterium]
MKMPHFLLLLVLLNISFVQIIAQAPTQLITNIQLVDGTGGPSKHASVRIKGDIISQIGTLNPLPNEEVIDGHGLVLAPGFIDSHSHHFGDLRRNPAGLSTSNQGITTIIIGQDGDSYPMDSLTKFMKERPIVANVASYTGQAALRSQVMGEKNVYRKASQAEIDRMKLLLKGELLKGAIGLSTGLEYEAAFYSTRDEVLQLAQVAADYNGRYTSHIRSEDINMNDALDEIIEIGRSTKMPVQVSHIKIAKRDDWGKAKQILKRLEQARAEGINICADIYPYTFWNSTLRVLFPDKQFTNMQSAQFAVDQLFDANESVVVAFAPNSTYVGKTLAVIAAQRKEQPAQTLMNLIQMASDFDAQNPDYKGSTEAIAGKSMNENDVVDFIQWPYANICSDGNAGGHPRGYGAFTRVLGKYVREKKLMPLETAIYKMTGMTADFLAIKDRGVIAVGKKADMVLLNPATVNDNATINNSKLLSTGIETVWVNGQIVYKAQKATGKLPGVLLIK